MASERFFRRRQDELRGDEHASWGGAIYYFATDDLGVVRRQIEVYDDGHVLIYDKAHMSNAVGMLSDQPLDLDDMAPFELSEPEFVAETNELRPSPG